MIVLADASPLSALADIGEMTLLPKLYGTVIVPETVRRECLHPHAPAGLAGWFSSSTWLRVVPDPQSLLPEVADLDPGEAAAITLACQFRTEALLIIDDLDGRRLCETLQLRRTGTAGVLFAAAQAGLVDFEYAISRLQETSFRLGTSVVDELRRCLRRGQT